MERIVELVRRSLAEETYPEFDGRVAEQADRLRRELTDGRLDNGAFSLGLEIEVYAVDAERRLVALDESAFDSTINKELGAHNAELNTEPTPFSGAGLAAQLTATERQLAEARRLAGDDRDVVLDAMWGLGPAGGTKPYFTDIEERDGVSIARNMCPNPRYCALDNETRRLAGGDIDFSVAGAEHAFPSMLFESLATSIQPHLQVPDTDAFIEYFNAAIRTLGPVVALTSNSPFLPGDLYNDVDDPGWLVDETAHELRIAAFEQSMNQSKGRKVKVPADIENIAAVVDRVVDDATYAPFLEEWVREETPETFADRFFEFGHKRGTYWRWVRPVVGGTAVEGVCDQRSLRIEYRPVPTQPTVRDNVAALALVAGLLRGIVATDHPLTDLPWSAAEDAFYAAVEDGIDASLAWVTAEGERTDDTDRIFAELFALAREGLDRQGVGRSRRERLLGPLRARVEARTTPSVWKKDRVADRLAAGATLETAIAETHREYVELSRGTDSFADWL